MENKMLNAALDYLQKGFAIIPIKGRKYAVGKTEEELIYDSKKPLIKWKEFQTRKPTEFEVRGWWEKWPEANLAVVTGQVSGIYVIDIDTDEGKQAIEEYLPDSFITPTSETGNGGQHLLCTSPTPIGNNTRAVPGCDFRGEGGYAILPPSIAYNGKPYIWTVDLSTSTSPLPMKYASFINSYSSLCIKGDPKGDAEKMFEDGRRDNDLFHVANLLIKGGAQTEEATNVLEILAKKCNPPFPEKEVAIKIQSALSRARRKDRNLSEEVREWVLSTTGNFLSIDIIRSLQLSTREDNKNLSKILKRLSEQEIIEKFGKKDGCWRKIDRSYTEQCWWEGDGTPLPLHLPLGAGKLARIYAGNVLLLEGQKSQGKSAFALEFVRLNSVLFDSKALYQNVEMADSELTERFNAYGDIMTPEQWRNCITIIRQTSEWWDKILPDGLNVVDYLVEYKEAYLIADFIWKIHQKLKKGIALILVQRDPLKPYPVGGRGVRDIPRLIMSLIRHRIKLEDVKSFYPSEYGNPTGLVRKYKQVAWWKFKADSAWHHEEEKI